LGGAERCLLLTRPRHARRLHVAGAHRMHAHRWRTAPAAAAAAAATYPKRLLIEARWGSKPLAFAGKLQPRRLIK
jgi:hypothetical protein